MKPIRTVITGSIVLTVAMTASAAFSQLQPPTRPQTKGAIGVTTSHRAGRIVVLGRVSSLSPEGIEIARKTPTHAANAASPGAVRLKLASSNTGASGGISTHGFAMSSAPQPGQTVYLNTGTNQVGWVKFPITAEQTDFSDPGHMVTDVTLSAAPGNGPGTVSGKTHVWTGNELYGFDGEVQVILLDANGKELYRTPAGEHKWDIKGHTAKMLTGGSSGKHETWQDSVPKDALLQVQKVKVQHIIKSHMMTDLASEAQMVWQLVQQAMNSGNGQDCGTDPTCGAGTDAGGLDGSGDMGSADDNSGDTYGGDDTSTVEAATAAPAASTNRPLAPRPGIAVAQPVAGTPFALLQQQWAQLLSKPGATVQQWAVLENNFKTFATAKRVPLPEKTIKANPVARTGLQLGPQAQVSGCAREDGSVRDHIGFFFPSRPGLCRYLYVPQAAMR